MNPFTEPTIALPTVQPDVVQPDPAQKKSRLRLVPRFVGALCMVVSMGLAGTLLFPALAFAVNVNAATQTQLQAVRGIGPKTAQIIIDERMRGGDYESFEDLADRVKGIGPKKAASLQSAGLTVQSNGGSATGLP